MNDKEWAQLLSKAKLATLAPAVMEMAHVDMERRKEMARHAAAEIVAHLRKSNAAVEGGRAISEEEYAKCEHEVADRLLRIGRIRK